MKLLILLLISQLTYGQFYVNNKMNFHPDMLLPNHFTSLDLRPYTGQASDFDLKNPYTTLITLKDARNNSYQMVVQTSFLGNVQYAGFSMNLWMLFNSNTKPMFGFQNCMTKMNDIFNFAYPIDQLTECVVSRLNYCNQ